MLDSEVFGSRRINLDGPPPQPPSSPRPSPEALYDSSSGTVTKESEQSNSISDPGVRHAASALAKLAQIQSLLEELGTLLPEITPLTTDTVTVLRQAVPQAIANFQSSSPGSHAGAQTTAQFQGLFGGGGMGSQPSPPIAAGPPISAPPGGAGGVMG